MRPPRDRGDEGYSLIELIVTTTIMSILTLILVSATTEIYSGTKQIDNTAEARDQLDNTFRRLDRELRYAKWLADPVLVSGAWTLRFELPSGCRELRVTAAPASPQDSRILTMAAWDPATATSGTAMPIANGVTLINNASPFLIYPIGAQPYASAPPATGMGSRYALDFVQVRLLFNVKIGVVTLPFDSIFTAQNTTRGAKVSDCS